MNTSNYINRETAATRLPLLGLCVALLLIGLLHLSTLFAQSKIKYGCAQIDGTDNLGYYDTCISNTGSACSMYTSTCAVYNGATLPSGVDFCTPCLFQEKEGCGVCVNGIGYQVDSAIGACTHDNGPDSCYCEFSTNFPPPPLTNSMTLYECAD